MLEGDGLLVDTQPVSPRPPLAAAGHRLGRLDMRQWLTTIQTVDALVDEAIAADLFSVEHEQRLRVTDVWDDGRECAEMIAGWQGVRLPSRLAKRIVDASAPLTIDQEVRLRVLLAGSTGRP